MEENNIRTRNVANIIPISFKIELESENWYGIAKLNQFSQHDDLHKMMKLSGHSRPNNIYVTGK